MFLKRTLLILIIGLMTYSMIGCTTENNNSTNDKKEGVVATVNGVEIESKIFEKAVEQITFEYEQQGADLSGDDGEAILQQIEQQAINSLIQEEVLLQAAKEKGHDISDEAVVEELDKIKTQYPTEQDFESVLQENQLTEDELKDMIMGQMLIENFLKGEVKEVSVSEDEVKAVYEQYKAQMELQMEGAEEAQEMPPFENIKDMLKTELMQRKEQEQVGQIIEKLVEESEIETYL